MAFKKKIWIDDSDYVSAVELNRIENGIEESLDYYNLIIDVTAPQGDKGPTGLKGIQGKKGVTGETGPQGPIDDSKNIPGPPGRTGRKGDTGLQGPEGTIGANGQQGPQGTSFDITTISTGVLTDSEITILSPIVQIGITLTTVMENLNNAYKGLSAPKAKAVCGTFKVNDMLNCE